MKLTSNSAESTAAIRHTTEGTEADHFYQNINSTDLIDKYM